MPHASANPLFQAAGSSLPRGFGLDASRSGTASTRRGPVVDQGSAGTSPSRPVEPRPGAEARRRAWREYTRTDAPQGERKAREAIERANRAARSADAQWLAAVTPVHADAGQTLADATRALLLGPELPWDARARLVELGASLGLSRFDSSLIIASVQHRANQEGRPERRSTVTVEPRAAPRTDRRPDQRSGTSVGSIAAMVVLALGFELLAVLVWFAS